MFIFGMNQYDRVDDARKSLVSLPDCFLPFRMDESSKASLVPILMSRADPSCWRNRRVGSENRTSMAKTVIRMSLQVDGTESRHINRQVGQWIRHLRMRKGLTQADLGRRLDRHQSTISELEMGRTHLSVRRLFEVLEALDYVGSIAIDPTDAPTIRRIRFYNP